MNSSAFLWRRFRNVLPIAFFLLTPADVLDAQDWPSWGGTGPARNMYSTARQLPENFDPGTPRPGTEEVEMGTTRNVKWTAKLGSQSFGNVVVAGGKVFIGTNNDPPRDPKIKGDRSILLCLDEQTGQFLWQLVVPKLKSGNANDWANHGLLSSPAVVGDRAYVVTTRGEVLCLTTHGLGAGNVGPFADEGQYMAGPGHPALTPGPRDADIVWRYDMMEELGAFPHNGSTCSPLVIGDRIYVNTGNGMDWTHRNVPFPRAPTLIALDRLTGKLLAEDDAQIGSRIFHAQWSSPSGGNVGGRQLVFLGGGDGLCYAFDAEPVREPGGNFLKTVWKVDCNPPEYKARGARFKYPAAEGPSEINATPVFWKNRVYVATGQDPEHGEGVGNLRCIDATPARDDAAGSRILWRNKVIQRSLSTVSIDPETGLLFVADFSGFVHCLDAETGASQWVLDSRAHVWGSTLVADGKVYFGDEEGDFFILTATRQRQLLSEVNLGAPIYSTPVAANGVLFLQSQSHLYAVQAAEGQPLATAARNVGGPRVLMPTAWPTPLSSNAVMGVAFSADSSRLALATRKTIEVWNVREDQRLYVITNEMSGSQRGLSYARDPGTLALINGRSGTLWKIEGAEGPLPVAGEHGSSRYSPYGIALSPDARWLATCGEDKLVKIWDTDQGQLHQTLEHSASVFQVAFFPDGQRLAAASGSWGKNMRTFTGTPGEVTVWNVEDGAAVKSLKADRFCVWSVAISGNGELIAAGTGLYQRLEESGEVLVWNPRTGERVGSFPGYPGCVFTVGISPDGKRIAAAGGAASSRKATAIWIWDLASGRHARILEGHHGTIYSIAFSPDGAWLASGSVDGTARLWRVD